MRSNHAGHPNQKTTMKTDPDLKQLGEQSKFLASASLADALTGEMAGALKAQFRAELLVRNIKRGGKVLYAEGDSWFDIPWWVVGNKVSDVLDALAYHHGYVVPDRAAKAGDTLENMVQPGNLKFLEFQLANRKPDAFLVSAGGNDLFGINDRTGVSQFYKLMNPAGSRSGKVNVTATKEFLSTLRPMFKKLQIIANKAEVPMFLHGYSNAYASGKRVFFKWGGPWIEPMVTRRGYSPAKEGHEIVSDIAKYFNEMLEGLASRSGETVFYVDARVDVSESDWHDELHLWPWGLKKVAAAFHQVLSNYV